MSETEKRLRIYRALTTNPEWVEILQDALALQQKGEAEQAKGHFWLGFEWFDVHANPQTLKKMVTSKSSLMYPFPATVLPTIRLLTQLW